jgi:hypothetical protein
VCTHLLGETAGLGFNRNKPTNENPFPDAWCDDCELIRSAHDGWNEQSEKLAKISLLCSGGYERARIRNTRTSVTLDDLADLRGSAAAAKNGTPHPALILVMLLLITGAKNMKRRAVVLDSYQAGAKTAAALS